MTWETPSISRSSPSPAASFHPPPPPPSPSPPALLPIFDAKDIGMTTAIAGDCHCQFHCRLFASCCSESGSRPPSSPPPRDPPTTPLLLHLLQPPPPRPAQSPNLSPTSSSPFRLSPHILDEAPQSERATSVVPLLAVAVVVVAPMTAEDVIMLRRECRCCQSSCFAESCVGELLCAAALGVSGVMGRGSTVPDSPSTSSSVRVSCPLSLVLVVLVLVLVAVPSTWSSVLSMF
ncbi:hypothetical protein F5888DRAFT_1681912 [Russula emetica]|nr:hypothetical protein F5888DRAFT_1681912 [Russula emetica]